MDVVLWILIGLAAGATVATLMPESQPHSRSGSAQRAVRDMAAGLGGAIAGGYAFVLYNPSLRTDGLTTAFASLAGALWLAGIVEVVASGRHPDEQGAEGDTMESVGTPNGIEMPAYDVAREALIAGLIEDALAHEAGDYAKIGRQLPAIRDAVSRHDPLWNSRLQLALRFWSGWAVARDDGWRRSDSAAPIAVGDWPRIARTIASDLARDRETIDAAVVSRFAYATDAPA